MAIVTIEEGSLCDSSIVNSNFESLYDDIQTLSSNLDTYIASLKANISTLSSSITSSVETLQESIDELQEALDELSSDDYVSSDLTNLTTSQLQLIAQAAMPNYTKRASRTAGTTYQASSPGYIYIATTESDGSSYSNWNFYVGASSSSLYTFPVKTIAPGTGRDNKCVMFPIPDGYYYKTDSRTFTVYYFIPCFSVSTVDNWT